VPAPTDESEDTPPGLLAERDSCKGAKDLKSSRISQKGVTVYVVICGYQFKGQLLCNLKKQAFI
jgi:hypothetical protein